MCVGVKGLTSSVLLLAAGVPLTLHNVTTAISNVEWEKLCRCLRVPESRKYHIEQQASEHHKRVLAEWWLLTDPAPSWRRLISRFDLYGDLNPSCAAAADFMRHNAEPVQSTLFTFISLFMSGFHTGFLSGEEKHVGPVPQPLLFPSQPLVSPQTQTNLR